MNSKVMIPVIVLMFALGSPVLANDEDGKSVGQKLTEARLEGQLWATYSLNRHLNPFDLDVEVDGETAILAGKVEDPVQKDLAAQIALGTDGIEDVDNRIEVDQDIEVSRESGYEERGFGDRVSDLNTTARVKSKLLWNRNTSGFSANVSTKDGHVVLEGKADSEAGKDLAGRLAANTEGVKGVSNRIVVEPESESEIAEKSRETGSAVSDGWITAKVKSTLLFSSNVSGTDINVDTEDGVVRLKGHVASAAEKDLAVKLSEDIRGVTRVDASGLKVVG